MAKAALTTDEQIALLRQRGLRVDDEDHLRLVLTSVGYYRLSGYFRYWQASPGDGVNDFLAGSTSNDIVDALEFDSMLRSVLLDGLGIVEIALKSALASTWALSSSPLGYLDPKELDYSQLGSKGVPFASTTLDRVLRDIDDSREEYIVHHRAAGQSVPVWAGLGVQTLGTVSKLYRVCGHTSVQQHVARSLGLKDINMASSVFEGMSVLRNLCAHHHRLWNRTGLIAVQIPNAWKMEQNPAFYRRTPWALITALRGTVRSLNAANPFDPALDSLLAGYTDMIEGLKRPRSTQSSATVAYRV